MASKAGLPIDIVSAVQSAVSGATIRAGLLEDIVMFSTALSAELEFVAKTYTGCVNTSEMVWDEAMDFIVDRFGGLNIREIRFAFRLAAAGELGNISLKAYYGTFTVGMLGDVLHSYLDRREELYRAVRRAENETLLIASESSKKCHDQEAWKKNRLKYLKLIHTPTIEDVTAYDYEFLSKDGHISFSVDERRLIYDRAKPLVIRDLSNQAMSASGFRAREINTMISQAQSGHPSDSFRARQKSMAQRLAVVDWLNSFIHQ